MNDDGDRLAPATKAAGAHVSERWARWRAETPIERYEARFAALDRAGRSAHGEADFIETYGPRRVLDAGCGTGRVAIELHRRGVEVVGVDLDGEMLAAAVSKAPDIAWIEADLAELAGMADRAAYAQRAALDVDACHDLEPSASYVRAGSALLAPFDVVAMPGNVMLFCKPESRAPIIASLARLLRPEGRLITGFSLQQGVGLDEYEEYCTAVGLTLERRLGGWDGGPFVDDPAGRAPYVVIVHRRPVLSPPVAR